MLDASAKIPSGLLMGNIVELGNYDECIAVQGNSSKGQIIRGQHCMLRVSLSELNPNKNNTKGNFDQIRSRRM